MDQLQANLYKLLAELDEICKRNDVTYYLAGGTALGAIRGGGFLPWDDDIDLYITRENWNKLVKVMETQTPENRVFVCVENDDIYCNPVGRYVDKETTVMMKSQLLCGKACGQLIEFFVMDPMPLGEDAKWNHRKLVKVYTELLSPYFVVNRNILHENTEFDFDLYNKYYKKSLIFGKKKVLNELLEKITSTTTENSDCYCMRWGTRTLMYGIDLLGEPRMEKFEDAMFPVPAKQEEVARIAYGDSWMYVPEGSGKVVHNLDKDLMTPFQQYVDLYKPLLNETKLMRNYKKNKRIRAKALYKKNEFKYNFACSRAKIAAKHIVESDYDINVLRELLKNKDFAQLQKHLSYFYSVQFNPDIKVDNILVPVSDEYIYIAVMNHVLQGAYYKVNSIMSARKNINKPLTDELQEADRIMQFCKQLSIAIYDKKDIQLVENILQENTQYSHMIPDYARGELWVMCQKANTNADYEKLLKEAKDRVALFVDDGEIMRYEAYALYMLDKKDESKEKYIDAIQRTRNGFVWKEVNDLFGIDAYDVIDNQEDDDENEDVEDTKNDD